MSCAPSSPYAPNMDSSKRPSIICLRYAKDNKCRLSQPWLTIECQRTSSFLESLNNLDTTLSRSKTTFLCSATEPEYLKDEYLRYIYEMSFLLFADVLSLK
ncbi:uncharacterized protein PHALS_08432 [Plasmopara halstedii]|uniref:Uncharacterized protein n=1 Tax=Plasmopara halstedii TaxID=4781 RepID=A0A0P1ACU7_PLAHL|nr:uncharacterized protein PHALS_08432 [Plasmopara halstedii]CEG38352.1 hypothetical protein PHALS_08432 [Plasmopara halstedii]|eukprot:XP_024574721.1 hypothetical protein PHALS_08432 [Plasmopara halstedii]